MKENQLGITGLKGANGTIGPKGPKGDSGVSGPGNLSVCTRNEKTDTPVVLTISSDIPVSIYCMNPSCN